MARKFYEKEEILLVIPQKRGEEVRVMIGTRDDGTEYLDIRTWYPDEFGDKLLPGKGIGKPLKNGMWDEIARAILDREEIRKSGQPRIYTQGGTK